MNSNNRFRTFLFGTTSDNKIILVRLIVGLVFLTEGIQKFLFPELGPLRFEKIGFADPAFWAYFVAYFEIVCGTLVLLGLLTRLVAIPLFIVMMTAFVTTKWPILMDKGIWAMAHEYRTDFAMTLLLIYLLISGGGRWSVDSQITFVGKRL